MALGDDPIVLDETARARLFIDPEVSTGLALMLLLEERFVFALAAWLDLCVRSCCFMLSLRVKVLPHVGQATFFSPVCFLPCRAACPEVVKVSLHPNDLACGHGYFFLGWVALLVVDLEVELLEVMGVDGSVLIGDMDDA